MSRTGHINELIKALPMVEGFPLTEKELWDFFKLAVKNKDIPIRNISTKKEQSDTPKRISGYNLFTKTYNSGDSDGQKATMKEKGAVWKELTDDEKNKFRMEACEVNKFNGIEVISKTTSLKQQTSEWVDEFKVWCETDKNIRGPEPLMPHRKPNALKNHIPDQPLDGY